MTGADKRRMRMVYIKYELIDDGGGGGGIICVYVSFTYLEIRSYWSADIITVY